MTKYGSVKVNQDGYNFASKLEASTYQVLKLRELAGEIKILQCQFRVLICGPGGHECSHKNKIEYIADFLCSYQKTGEKFLCEAKGFASEKWPLKLRLCRHYLKYPLEIWGGTHLRPYLIETIYPSETK